MTRRFDPETALRSTCAYCGVGCGVVLSPDGAGGLEVRGDKGHPANFGRLCSKGSALGETLSLEGRLLDPVVDGETASWDRTLDEVASRFAQTIEEHGPDSVAFYVSGQLLTEDYYVANKLMKGFIGSANIDTNSRLCMASTVAGHRRAFGTDTVPGRYEDLEEADLIVLVGSNLAWCHPVLAQRIQAAKAARPGLRLINIDPRRTASTDMTDQHLSIAPGGDVALFNRLLVEIAAAGAVDEAYVAAHVNGFDAALAAAQEGDIAPTGLSEAEVTDFCAQWIGAQKVVTVFSQGVNQSSAGSDKVNAILNCHLATGRIGKRGMGPFSVTGQPNAMGGREVGGLANMLACHMDIDNAEHRAAVRDFWSAPRMAPGQGAKAVDMFDRIARGEIKALWVMCTNPAASMPDADRVRAAIAGCDFVAVSEMYGDTDTARLADVLLPATGWSEKDGTVTNSERCISRQRGVLPAPGQARHDWDIIAEVGRRMGWGLAFDYENPAEIFREYAALSGLAAGFGLDFDISGLADLSDAEFDGLAPTYWPVPKGAAADDRFFAEGGFFTGSGKANMLALSHRAPAAGARADHPFIFNTGRVRDQWHTMSRTGLSPRLNAHLPEPYLDLHPRDAAAKGIEDGRLVEVSNAHGRAILRAKLTENVQPGQVFAPIHWTGVHAGAARVDALVPSVVDPVSGQPESKAAQVDIAPFGARWFGFLVSDCAPELGAEYWVRARIKAGWQAEIAGIEPLGDCEAYLRAATGISGGYVQRVSDPARGLERIALIEGDRLRAALFIGPEPLSISRGFVGTGLGQDSPPILAGHPGADQPDPGAIVCACENVGINTIIAGIQEQGLLSVEAIGEALGAGTNCGSCRPEIAGILRAHAPREAAE